MRFGFGFIHAHFITRRRVDFDGGIARVLKAIDIHAHIIRTRAFIMKDIYPAAFTKVMLRDFHIPLIEREAVFACRNAHISFGNFDHDGISHRTKRAITCRELFEAGFNFKLNLAAMAIAFNSFHNLIPKMAKGLSQRMEVLLLLFKLILMPLLEI